MNSGDFTYRGAKEKYVMEVPCHYLQFRLTATPINREAEGNYIGIGISPKGDSLGA